MLNFSDSHEIANCESQLGALFDDPDFHEIHRRVSDLNIFEAVGAVRAELRHSNFLAYILSPSRPHGLGSMPLVAVLRAFLARLPAQQRPIRILEVLAGESSDAIVYRERGNIDILIELPKLKLVIAIENKVDAKAGDGQLESYRNYVRSAFGQYRRLLIYLTPGGDAAQHDEFVAFDYAALAETLENLTLQESQPIPAETELVIRHYVNMVRRHIVQDDQLRALALTLYERYREAFEFVLECRPQPRTLLTVGQECVQSVQGLVEDSRGSNLFRFLPQVWDDQLTMVKGDSTKWSKTGRGVLFEIKTYANAPGRLNLAMILGPGDAEMRSRVYSAALAQPNLFAGIVKPMGTQWATIFSRDLLTVEQAKSLSFEAQSNCVRFAWSEFQTSVLQSLIDAILAFDQTLFA